MALHKVIISGFGGQGVMMMGQLIAYAGMIEDHYVTWLPAYGPEMRGGTANCSIIISDKPISSPVISRATAVVAMNYPSLLKFEPLVITGGFLFINTSLIEEKMIRNDLVLVEVNANEIALGLENDKTSNMVMLGALIGCTDIVKIGSLHKAMEKVFSGAKKKLIPLNKQALELGSNLVLERFQMVKGSDKPKTFSL